MFSKQELINIHVVTCIVSWISLIAGVGCMAMGLAEWGMYSLKWVYFTNAIVCVFAFLITHYIGRAIHRYILSLDETALVNDVNYVYFFFIDTFYIAPCDCEIIFRKDGELFSIKTVLGATRVKVWQGISCESRVFVTVLFNPQSLGEYKDIITFTIREKETRLIVPSYIGRQKMAISLIQNPATTIDIDYKTGAKVFEYNDLIDIVPVKIKANVEPNFK